MEQNLTFLTIVALLLGSSVLAAIISATINHYSNKRLIFWQEATNARMLKAQLAEKFMIEEGRERKKFCSLLYSKVTNAYAAAVSAWWVKDIDKAREDLIAYYKKHYLLFGFEKHDNENMNNFVTNLGLAIDYKWLRERSGQVDGRIESKNYQELSANFEKVVQSILRKNNMEQLTSEAINFAHSVVEKVGHVEKTKEMIENG